MVLKGKIFYRYPGLSPKVCTLGKGEDRFYICPFGEKEPTIFSGSISAYEGQSCEVYSSDATPFCSSKEEYLSQFQKYLSAFKEKGISKAILSRIESKDLRKVDLNGLFEVMCSMYPSAFCYVFSIEGIGVWAGASPEILLSYEKDVIATVALAGTKYTADKEVWTEKEHVEHRLVEDYIKMLGTDKTPLEEETKPTIIKAGSLYHLKSTFKFKAEKQHVSDFLSRIHPTPAICGLPFEKSKQLILDIEKHDRSYYCGYLGVVDHKSDAFKMYVNIRCMQVIDNKAFLYIGGGITKDSQGEMEWEETVKKSETMGKVWGNKNT